MSSYTPVCYNTTEYKQFWSCWNVNGRASMKISTDCLITHANWESRITPISISFKCHRQFSCIDSDVYDVFIRAIQGKSHNDMDENPLGCSHESVTGGCGNKRGYLSECRCDLLNRKTNPQIRHNYENRVISQIIEILKKQNIACFRLNLAIFCSGGLLGEEILLFRLFDQLKRRGASGVINLFLIDHCYDQAIKASSLYHRKIAHGQSASFHEVFGGQKDLEQFLLEICKSTQPAIRIEGTVFSDSNQYIEKAKSHNSFKHHLIIGADIENANHDMGTIAREAGLGEMKPIALVKTDKPLLCELDISGNLENCYIPDQIQQGAQPTLKHNHQQGGCTIA